MKNHLYCVINARSEYEKLKREKLLKMAARTVSAWRVESGDQKKDIFNIINFVVILPLEILIVAQVLDLISDFNSKYSFCNFTR